MTLNALIKVLQDVRDLGNGEMNAYIIIGAKDTLEPIYGMGMVDWHGQRGVVIMAEKHADRMMKARPEVPRRLFDDDGDTVPKDHQ